MTTETVAEQPTTTDKNHDDAPPAEEVKDGDSPGADSATDSDADDSAPELEDGDAAHQQAHSQVRGKMELPVRLKLIIFEFIPMYKQQKSTETMYYFPILITVDG